MSFIGSSKDWGEQSCARLCQIVMEANDGMAQQVIENRTDLLDLLSLEQLDSIDDFGLTLPYIAVQYDRPDMIRYLAKRGIDMKKPCDGMNFGNPMFYAINMGRIAVIEALHISGCPVTDACDKYMHLTPEYHAIRTDNTVIQDKITYIKNADLRAAMLFKRNYLRYKAQTAYQQKRTAIIHIERIVRGFVVRSRRWRKLHESKPKKVLTVNTESSSVLGDDETEEDGETEIGDVDGGVSGTGLVIGMHSTSEGGFEGSEVLHEGSSSIHEGEEEENSFAG